MKEPWFEIVGVVADVKNRGLQQAIEPEVWVPYTVTASAGSGILALRRLLTARDQHDIRIVDSHGDRFALSGKAYTN